MSIKIGFGDYKKEEVNLFSLKAVYVQNGDTNDENDTQELEVELEVTVGVGDEPAKYFTISTKRWALDNIDELAEILKDFEKRINIQT